MNDQEVRKLSDWMAMNTIETVPSKGRTWFEAHDGEIQACAIGHAYIQSHGKSALFEDDATAFVWVNSFAEGREFEYGEFRYRAPLYIAIFKLNDVVGYSREQIIQWLKEQGL